MKRRVKAGGKTSKLSHRKAMNPKRGSRRTMAHGSVPTVADLQEQLDRSRRELRETTDQQSATAEILRVIRSSMADTRPVFDKILESCKHLFGGDELDVLLVDEQGQLNIAAYLGDSHDVVAATFPAPVERTPAGRAIRERRVVHWPDLVSGKDVPGVLRKMSKLIGYRSMVFAPMVWEDHGIGAIGVARSTGPFKPKELAMLQTFADQAVIAIQNARLFNELRESLQQQTATGDVLNVISNSLTDTQPVFDTIVRSGLRLFGDAAIIIALPKGDQAVAGAIADLNPARAAMLGSRLPIPLTRKFMHSRVIIDGKAIEVPDADNPPADLASGAQNFRASGFRAVTIVPMMKAARQSGR